MANKDEYAKERRPEFASAFLIRQQLGHQSISSSLAYCTVSDADAGRVTKQAFMEAF